MKKKSKKELKAAIDPDLEFPEEDEMEVVDGSLDVPYEESLEYELKNKKDKKKSIASKKKFIINGKTGK